MPCTLPALADLVKHGGYQFSQGEVARRSCAACRTGSVIALRNIHFSAYPGRAIGKDLNFARTDCRRPLGWQTLHLSREQLDGSERARM